MTRIVTVGLAALFGLVAGAITMLSLPAPATVDLSPEAPPPSSPPATRPPDGDLAIPEHDPVPDGKGGAILREQPTKPLGEQGGRLLLVWTAGGLAAGFAGDVAALPGVDAVTTVAGGRLDLIGSRTSEDVIVDEVEAGWAIPLDTLAIDPAQYAGFLPAADRPTVAALESGKALLGATSAQLRRLGPGDTLTVDGAEGSHELTVTAVVDDTLVGAAEVVVSRADAEELGIGTARFLLLTHTGDRAELESAIRRQHRDREVRVRGTGETPYLRHGDAVLPQALVKAEFGEFAVRLDPGGGGAEFAQSRDWQADNLTTVEVPLLGTVRCHRGIVKQLAGALGELEERGLDHLVDRDEYAGCHAARLISPGGGVSRHAWGIAVDLNASTNPTGQSSGQDRRLVDVFAQWGFTSGGSWLVPDPMHFEYVGPPDPDVAKIIDPLGSTTE